MKKKKQIPALLAALVLALGILAGCAGSPATQTSAASQAAPEPAQPAQQKSEQAADAGPAPADREITDMAGRVMTIPEEIETAFSTNSVSSIYLYTLVPDKLLGWNYALNETERSVIPEKYHSLPNFGMGDAVNYEAVVAAGPTIAFNVSSINKGTMDESDKLAERLGVPVVMVSARLEDAPEVYRFMGELFGVPDQAEKLAVYAENTFNDIAGMTIPENQKVCIYYGNGEDSLETAPTGSPHGQIINMVNALNAADLELGDGSRIRISLEQLLSWDPDIIIVNGEPKSNMSGGTAAAAILNDGDFATLKAVKNNMVFGAPNAPFNWIDRPPGPNRIIGMRWLAKKIYPDYFDYDVDEEVREFFRLFYHTELDDERLAGICNGF